VDVAVVLKAGKERPVQQRHPWVFSGAVGRVRGAAPNGASVDVLAANGDWLARGMLSHESQIRVRLLSWEPDVAIDEQLLRDRIAQAVAMRAALPHTIGPDGAERLIFAESDGLPGLIVDRYGAFLVVQLLTYGMAQRADMIVALLAERLAPQGIYERSDADVRQKEGLPPFDGVRWGAEPGRLVLEEHGARVFVDLRAGQKTGLYLDQRFNRQRVAAYCAGAELLDCFCYTGGFGLHAARAGAASVTAVDSSAEALETMQANWALNDCAPPLEVDVGNAFSLLRRYRAEARRWDVIVLDPPKFAQSQAQVEQAARGYKDINLLALQLLRPGGILATFSCSGLIGADLFQKIVFGAAVDARRPVQILERLGQAPDHPVLLTFPEAEYLKGLICRVH
jgi:23S rRNA (cytosine1962-C5)-methyltransferase